MSYILVELIIFFLGTACRYRVISTLSKQFSSPAEADEYYRRKRASEPNSSTSSFSLHQLPCTVETPVPPVLSTMPLPSSSATVSSCVPFSSSIVTSSSCAPLSSSSVSVLPSHTPSVNTRSTTPTEVAIEQCRQALISLEADDQLNIISELFLSYLRKHHSRMRLLPGDFLKLVVLACNHLHQSGRGNVIYLLAKALGTTRPDGSDSLLPTSRMPMGLLEYIVTFFTASSVQKASYIFSINIIIYMCSLLSFDVHSTIGSLPSRLP